MFRGAGLRRRACRIRRAVASMTWRPSDLMAEHHDLRVLGRLAAAQQHQPAKDPDRDQVEQAKSQTPDPGATRSSGQTARTAPPMSSGAVHDL